MRVVADLVIGSDGYLSVWLDHERAMQMAVRMHGVVRGLVDEREAQQREREAFQRGVIEGQALSGSALCRPLASETQSVDSQKT